MKTELVWEGKYDEYGNRREVDVAGLAMPMQRVESIDQPRSEAAAQGQQGLLAFEKKNKRANDFRNMLVWGDNKLVAASLLKDFKGKIDLIYIDPPFDVGADFTMDVAIGDGKETLEKDQSTLEMIAYRDMWGKGEEKGSEKGSGSFVSCFFGRGSGFPADCVTTPCEQRLLPEAEGALCMMACSRIRNRRVRRHAPRSSLPGQSRRRQRHCPELP